MTRLPGQKARVTTEELRLDQGNGPVQAPRGGQSYRFGCPGRPSRLKFLALPVRCGTNLRLRLGNPGNIGLTAWLVGVGIETPRTPFRHTFSTFHIKNAGA